MAKDDKDKDKDKKTVETTTVYQTYGSRLADNIPTIAKSLAWAILIIVIAVQLSGWSQVGIENAKKENSAEAAAQNAVITLDMQINSLDPFERDKHIDNLLVRLEYVWGIPQAESREVLNLPESHQIPGNAFWREMGQRYEFKRLRRWSWDELPSDITEVPTSYVNENSGETVAYSYVLRVPVKKSEYSRPIPQRGWFDFTLPNDPLVTQNHIRVCDRGTPNQITAVWKNGKYYVRFADGREIEQDRKWYPPAQTSFDLQLLPDHPADEVNMIIRRTRRVLRPGDPEPPPIKES